jgi:hypothetical protein
MAPGGPPRSRAPVVLETMNKMEPKSPFFTKKGTYRVFFMS